MKKVCELIPYARNARTHSDEQVAQIAASITEFGWTNPILTDGEGGLIAGHGRLLAAVKLGLEDVPTIELCHLTDKQKRAYILADNKLSLNSGWDNKLLAMEIHDLQCMDFDLSLTGFGIDTEELFADLMAPSRFEKSQPNNFKEPDEDGDEAQSANLKKYPLTVILDETEFSEWDAMKKKTGHSDKRLLLELMKEKK